MTNAKGPRRSAGRWAVLLAALWLAVLAAGCNGGSSAARPHNEEQPQPPAPQVPHFDGQRALDLVRAQCAFGPRCPGSKGHAQMLQWLREQLDNLAKRVLVQKFRAATAFGGPYDFANVLAWLGPEDGVPFMLAAHWDTRPVADEDPDPANRDKPILGANDGGSGVAVLLEIARLLHQRPPQTPIILAFLDAEDSGQADCKMPYMGFCIGSKYLAEHWPKDWPKPEQGILLDLVGGDGQLIDRIPVRPAIHGDVAFDLRLEGHSLDANPSLVNKIWSIAEQLEHRAFVRKPCGYITDDHVPLIQAGIKMIDIIEVFPLTWHTIDDTPDHCSAQSLEQVGDTVVHFIYEELD